MCTFVFSFFCCYEAVKRRKKNWNNFYITKHDVKYFFTLDSLCFQLNLLKKRMSLVGKSSRVQFFFVSYLRRGFRIWVEIKFLNLENELSLEIKNFCKENLQFSEMKNTTRSFWKFYTFSNSFYTFPNSLYTLPNSFYTPKFPPQFLSHYQHAKSNGTNYILNEITVSFSNPTFIVLPSRKKWKLRTQNA